ncbi:MAG: hypothetical protein KGI25_06365 [Thaumarchaeota archaeon]|nr:hypothetical protein [Nitrososphaerota archaeon]
MARSPRLPKLTFTITPNANGYVVGCTEIPYLFTDITSLEEIDQTVRNMISEYVDSFPDDAKKKGVDKNIVTQTVWKGTPNSVALE